MSKLIVTLTAILATAVYPNSSMAGESGSVLGFKTGEPLSSIKLSLIEKGYDVEAPTITYKFIPDAPIYKLLTARKTTDVVAGDELLIASNLSPENPTASIIFRQVIYKGGKGPSLDKVRKALAKTMSPTSSNPAHRLSYLYRWKDGKQKRDKPFSITGLCLNLVSEMTISEVKDFNYYKPHTGEHYYHSDYDNFLHYIAKCDKVAGAQISLYKDTEIVKSIKVILMDNTLIEQGANAFDKLIDDSRPLYEEKLNADRKAVLDNTPEPEL